MKTQWVLSFFSLLIVPVAMAGQSQHLPDGFCPEIIEYSYYSLCYSPEHRQASWVKYKLTPELVNGKQKRTNDYRKDPFIDDPVTSSDYKGSGFDRGHLLPAADMKINRIAMSETFFMTNMSPQRPQFNRQIWAQMENHMRDLVRQHGEAHVVTAGILEPGLSMIKTGVSIPRWYFKMAYFPGPEVMKAFLIENKSYPKNTDINDFVVPVDDVEIMAGYDFFSDLPDLVESELEATAFR